jgi:hypothetical protein
MTQPIVFKNKDGFFSWMPEHSDQVRQALAGICEEMQGESDASIAEACTAFLRAQYQRFLVETGNAYGLSLEEVADMVGEELLKDAKRKLN